MTSTEAGSNARVVNADAAGVTRAAEALEAGELVVFPTETVYGLGANALDANAVERVFAAKKRPADNPLIVHVKDADAARALTRAWPEDADLLAGAFWPGPLTLVLPRADHVPDATTGGLDTVAVRVPDHPVAQALLAEAGVPLAAPSANASGRPSPTRVADAVADLGHAVAVYVDDGPTRVGVESTVVSLLGDDPVILREGGVPREALANVLGRPLSLGDDEDEDAPPLSPGTRYRHYAPNARVEIAPADADLLEAHADALRDEGLRVAVIASEEHAPPDDRDVRVPGSREDPGAWARQLFALLRDLDAAGYDAIVVEAIPERGVGAAVMNRLRKAAAAGVETRSV